MTDKISNIPLLSMDYPILQLGSSRQIHIRIHLLLFQMTKLRQLLPSLSVFAIVSERASRPSRRNCSYWGLGARVATALAMGNQQELTIPSIH